MHSPRAFLAACGSALTRAPAAPPALPGCWARSFAVNSIRGDYANLGSFGTPADVLVNLVPPAGTPGVKAEVLASLNKGKTYEFDYTLAFAETGVTRHLRTVWAVTHSPTGSDYLVTLTAQSEEPNYKAAKADLDAIVGSMKL